MRYISPYHFAILICFICSFSVFNRTNRSYKYLFFFPFFLLITLLVELYGGYLSYKGKSNTLLYNLFTTLEFSFYFYTFSKILSGIKSLKILRYVSIFYPIVTLINIFFIQGQKSFHSVTYSLGCLLVVSFCILYFYELFKLPRMEKLSKTPAFWICTALLFFYCCTFPLFSISNFLSNSSLWKTLEKPYDMITGLLNIFLYTLFSISFLCLVKIRKSIP